MRSLTPVFRLPDDSQRCFVCGMTGSGKTLAAGWQLSLRSWDRMPWTIVDFKRDGLIARIRGLEEIRLNRAPPKQAGLYVVRPRPDEHEQLQKWLWQLWERGKHGLWIDEGYMVGGQGRKSDAYDAILTQGRSKRIPVITLSQRPVWLPRFVVSESDFYQVFHLNSKTDRDKVREFVPSALDDDMPRYWSEWYDVAQRFHCLLKPVPDEATILQTFADRSRARKRVL